MIRVIRVLRVLRVLRVIRMMRVISDRLRWLTGYTWRYGYL